MPEPTDIDKIRKKRRRKLLLARIMILVALTMIATGIYAIKDEIVTIGVTDYMQELVAGNATGSGYPLDFGGDQTLGMYRIGNSIAVLTDSNFYIYNNSGAEVRSVQHKYSNPVVRIAGRRALIYDMGGKQLRVESFAHTVAEKKTNQPIYAGDISGRGEVAIAMGASQHLAQVKVYDRQLNEEPTVFGWLSAENYITDLSFMDDDKGIAASGVRANAAGDLVASVQMFRFDTGKVGAYEAENELVHAMGETKDGMWAITDRRAVLLSETGEVIQEHDYNYETLATFDYNRKGEIALMFGDYREDKSGRLAVLDATGALVNDISLPSHVGLMTLSDSYTAVVLDGQLLCYDQKGALVTQQTLTIEALAIQIIGSDVYVVSPETIEKFPLTRDENASKSGSGAESKSGSGAGSRAESESQESDAETESQIEPEPPAESGSGVDSQAGSGTGADSYAGSGPIGE